MRFVVGIDPGKTTGHALLTVADHRVDSGQTTAMQACQWIEQMLPTHGHNSLIAVERFTIGQETLKKTRQHDALDVIGAIKYLCWAHSTRFELNGPSEAKAMVNDERLKMKDYYQPGQPHANDAARHAVYAAVKHGWYSPDLLLKDG